MQVTEWKETLLGQAHIVFDRGKTHAPNEIFGKRGKEQLYMHIGQLKVKSIFLKTAVRCSASLCRRITMIEKGNTPGLAR